MLKGKSNRTTWKLARMNHTNLGPCDADSFRTDLHNRSRRRGTDFILANRPFSMSDWGDEHLLRTRALLLPRLLPGQVNLRTN